MSSNIWGEWFIVYLYFYFTSFRIHILVHIFPLPSLIYRVLNFQSFAVLSDKLEPLCEGVRHNKQMWLQMAAEDNPEELKEDEQNEWSKRLQDCAFSQIQETVWGARLHPNNLVVILCFAILMKLLHSHSQQSNITKCW